MLRVALVFTILLTCFCFANGQSACSTPDGQNGTCILLEECSPVAELFIKPDKTPTDIDFLRNSKCNQGDIPKVCCPTKSCQTPNGEPGACISFFSCPHLKTLIEPPVSDENIQYVKSSRCLGMGQYSVCCSEKPKVTSPGNCEAALSAFPVDPSSECCGIDATVPSKLTNGRGTELPTDSYPWLALIEHIQGDKVKLLCGGTLISARYVLTAAHCVVGHVLKYGTPKNVRLGEYDTRQDGPDCIPAEAGGGDCTEGVTTIPIELAIPHPGYNKMKNSPHDIALLRLLSMAPYTDFIRSICLPRADVPESGKPALTLFVAGWGVVADSQPVSPLKVHLELLYMDKEKCQAAYKSEGKSTQPTTGQICASGASGEDSCKGDSGGPLMYHNGHFWEVIGVAGSGLAPCGTPHVPGVYTKVFEYVDWIKRVIVA